MRSIQLPRTFASIEELVHAYRTAGGNIGGVASVPAQVIPQVLDLDVIPALTGWAKKIHEHIKGGKVDMSRIRLSVYFSTEQGTDSRFREECLDILKEVRNKRPGDAHLARYIHEHQQLIPIELRQYETLHFVGTLFSDEDGDICNISLSWRKGRWCINDYCLRIDRKYPVVLWQVEGLEP